MSREDPGRESAEHFGEIFGLAGRQVRRHPGTEETPVAVSSPVGQFLKTPQLLLPDAVIISTEAVRHDEAHEDVIRLYVPPPLTDAHELEGGGDRRVTDKAVPVHAGWWPGRPRP